MENPVHHLLPEFKFNDLFIPKSFTGRFSAQINELVTKDDKQRHNISKATAGIFLSNSGNQNYLKKYVQENISELKKIEKNKDVGDREHLSHNIMLHLCRGKTDEYYNSILLAGIHNFDLSIALYTLSLQKTVDSPVTDEQLIRYLKNSKKFLDIEFSSIENLDVRSKLARKYFNYLKINFLSMDFFNEMNEVLKIVQATTLENYSRRRRVNGDVEIRITEPLDFEDEYANLAINQCIHESDPVYNALELLEEYVTYQNIKRLQTLISDNPQDTKESKSIIYEDLLEVYLNGYFEVLSIMRHLGFPQVFWNELAKACIKHKPKRPSSIDATTQDNNINLNDLLSGFFENLKKITFLLSPYGVSPKNKKVI